MATDLEAVVSLYPVGQRRIEMKFIIQSWAGTHLFKDQEFDTFEEGWDFIRANVDNSEFDRTQNENDDAFQEYFVVEKP